jgi:hypothetical protein
MSTMTYDNPTARTGPAVAAPGSKRKGWFARALDRMAEARLRQAKDEIRRHGIVLSPERDRVSR